MAPEATTSLIKACALATGLTLKEVVTIAVLGPKRYKVYELPKRSGGQRTICHPSRELKALQHVFLHDILRLLPVHAAATAYKVGSSIKNNAAAHAASRVILKLDFENFFPSIKVADWAAYVRETMPDWSEEDISFSTYVMFWGEGGYKPRCLSIGAPTSPLISNALMYRFDCSVSEYAEKHNLTYTRYADDITISSVQYINFEAVNSKIRSELEALSYPRLQLKIEKTKLASKSTSRRVTGLVIANDGSLSLGHERKRLISSMVHHAINGNSDANAIMHLAGLLSFASDVEPKFVISLKKKYGGLTIEKLQLRKRAR